MYKYYCIFLYLLLSSNIFSQYGNMPLAEDARLQYEALLHEVEIPLHTSIKPYSSFEVNQLADSSALSLKMDTNFANQKWLGRKLFNEHFIQIKEGDFTIIANPTLNLRYGKDNQWIENNPYQNTRGFQLMGNIGSKFTFYSDFYENQALFPKYVWDFANANNVNPGQGRYKAFNEGDARDYGYANGNITYQPNKYFNFQLGHGKHFLGDGYRSLLLSDNSFNYPYFRITANLWKIKYWVLYTKLLDINSTYPNGTFLNKYIASHFVSFNITKRLNIGLFETIVYGDPDGTRGIDVNFLNPVIFFRPVEFSLGSRAGNALLGLNLKYKLTNKVYAYGQFVLDEFKFSELRASTGWWANKFGYQLGFKSFDTFIPGLMLQSEINWVRPYTYSHKQVLQNYAHFNQPLAHPLGANFMESVTNIKYNYKRFFTSFSFILANQGKDAIDTNWGSDTYISYDEREQDYDNKFLQGIKTSNLYINGSAGYIVNPSYNLRFEIGYTYRKFEPESETDLLNMSTTNYIYFGLSTKLNNYYYDF